MRDSVYDEDRFFINLETEEIVWMYHNPDAVSGDQFVSNIFGKNLFYEALDNVPVIPDDKFGADKVFDYIQSSCREYLSDCDSHEYDFDKAIFESEPFDTGTGIETLEKLRLAFAAKEEINKYAKSEFGHEADFSDITKVGLAYTTTEDGKHDIEAFANILKNRTEFYIDGELIGMEEEKNAERYVERKLSRLNFGELVDVPDWVISAVLKTGVNREGFEYLQLEAWGNTYDVCFEISHYLYGEGLSIEVLNLEDGRLNPYVHMTVNISTPLADSGCVFIDTNNFKQAEEFIEKYNLGEPTGKRGFSGYCVYPEYRLNMAEIEKHCMNPEALMPYIPEETIGAR